MKRTVTGGVFMRWRGVAASGLAEAEGRMKAVGRTKVPEGLGGEEGESGSAMADWLDWMRGERRHLAVISEKPRWDRIPISSILHNGIHEYEGTQSPPPKTNHQPER